MGKTHKNTGARNCARWFYKSKSWELTSRNYRQAHPICERCHDAPAVLVHHKIHITEANMRDVNVTLNWDNLEALCQSCHNEEHNPTKDRAKFDEEGRLIL